MVFGCNAFLASVRCSSDHLYAEDLQPFLKGILTLCG
jgi:hypothetical protein